MCLHVTNVAAFVLGKHKTCGRVEELSRRPYGPQTYIIYYLLFQEKACYLVTPCYSPINNISSTSELVRNAGSLVSHKIRICT